MVTGACATCAGSAHPWSRSGFCHRAHTRCSSTMPPKRPRSTPPQARRVQRPCCGTAHVTRGTRRVARDNALTMAALLSLCATLAVLSSMGTHVAAARTDPQIMRYEAALQGCALWNSSSSDATPSMTCIPVLGTAPGAQPEMCAAPPAGMVVSQLRHMILGHSSALLSSSVNIETTTQRPRAL